MRSRRHAVSRLAALTTAEPTYQGPIGLYAAPPLGYRLTDVREVVGSGVGELHRLGAALRSWAVHTGSGLEVVGAPYARVGARVSSLIQLGPLLVAAPCVVTAVYDEPDRRGFCYATLPGHPEQGAEAFIATLDDDGTLWLEVRAIWRPGSWLTRLTLPLAVPLQRRATRAYAESARRTLDEPG